MEILTPDQELTITRFSDRLSVVIGPDDMFPPDQHPDRTANTEPRPSLPAAEALGLAAVYELARARQERRARTGQVIARIDRTLELCHV